VTDLCETQYDHATGDHSISILFNCLLWATSTWQSLIQNCEEWMHWM